MLKLTIAALAAMLLTACGSPEKRTEKQQEKTILCGGYTRQRPLEASDRELFRRATAGMTGVSYTPESVATQVVAGTNYRFICTAKTATPGPETYEAEIIVFQFRPAAAGAGRGENREDHAVVAPPAALCKYSCRMSAWFSAAFFEA